MYGLHTSHSSDYWLVQHRAVNLRFRKDFAYHALKILGEAIKPAPPINLQFIRRAVWFLENLIFNELI